MKKANKKSSIDPKLKMLLKVQIINAALYTVLIFAAALILFSLDSINEKYYFYSVAVPVSFANFLSGYYTGIKLRKNGLLNSLIFCLPMTVLLLFISVAVNSFKIDLTALISAILMLCGAMLGGITSVNTKIRPKR